MFLLITRQSTPHVSGHYPPIQHINSSSATFPFLMTLHNYPANVLNCPPFITIVLNISHVIVIISTPVVKTAMIIVKIIIIIIIIASMVLNLFPSGQSCHPQRCHHHHHHHHHHHRRHHHHHHLSRVPLLGESFVRKQFQFHCVQTLPWKRRSQFIVGDNGALISLININKQHL